MKHRILITLILLIFITMFSFSEGKTAVLNFSIKGMDPSYSKSLARYMTGSLSKYGLKELLSYSEMQMRLKKKNLDNISGYNDDLLKLLMVILDVEKILLCEVIHENNTYNLTVTWRNVRTGDSLSQYRNTVEYDDALYQALDIIAAKMLGKKPEEILEQPKISDNSHAITKNDKQFWDLTIGASIVPIYYPVKFHSGFMVNEQVNMSDEDNPELFASFIGGRSFPNQYMGFGTGGANLHMAMTFFNNKRAMIGFSAYLEYSLHMNVGPLYILNNIITVNIAFRAKAGKYSSMYHFVSDFGLMGKFEIPHYEYGNLLMVGTYYYNSDISNVSLYFYPDFSWSIGPSLFLGFEVNRDNFSYEMGLFASVTVGSISYKDEIPYDGMKYNVFFIPIGLVLRWNYYHYSMFL